jgi:predicted P-loop ATPase
MLVSLVARALCPGIKYDTMVVLEGAQGRGKSSTLAVLGGEYYLEGLGAEDINGRDVVARLLGKWLVEIDEMEKARKADVNAFKSFLSHQKDTARLAYERTARDFHRRCCFVGTTNEDFYLKDDTGNRRFLPLRVTREIDLDEVRRERDQLFAEAVALWDADPRHESLVLPRDLWPAAAEEQELRRERHPWEEAIEQWLDHPDQTGLLGVQAGEILSEVIGRPLERQTKNDLKLVGAILRRLGWKFQSFRDPDRGGEVRKGFVPPDLRLAQLNWRRRLSKLPADARARAWEVMQ